MESSRYIRKCIIPNCNDRSSSRYKLPTKRIVVKQIWLSRIGNDNIRKNIIPNCNDRSSSRYKPPTKCIVKKVWLSHIRKSRRRYVQKCIIPNCNDRSSTRYRLPTKRIVVKQIWLSRIGNESLYKYSDEELNKIVVCGAHFLNVCKRATTLFPNALPTINMPGFTEEPTTTNSFYNENTTPGCDFSR